MIPIHRKNALRNNEHPPLTTVDRGLWTLDRGPWTVDCGPWTADCGLKNVFEVIQIIMPKHPQLRPRKPRSVHDARMDPFINDDDVLVAHKRAYRPHCRRVARRK